MFVLLKYNCQKLGSRIIRLLTVFHVENLPLVASLAVPSKSTASNPMCGRKIGVVVSMLRLCRAYEPSSPAYRGY
jgi:hypothetical protein